MHRAFGEGNRFRGRGGQEKSGTSEEAVMSGLSLKIEMKLARREGKERDSLPHCRDCKTTVFLETVAGGSGGGAAGWGRGRV